MISKVCLWSAVLFGALPSCLLCVATLSLLTAQKEMAGRLASDNPFYFHHSEWSFGPFEVTLYPRAWAVAAIAVGLLLQLAGIVLLLHVPNDSAFQK